MTNNRLPRRAASPGSCGSVAGTAPTAPARTVRPVRHASSVPVSHSTAVRNHDLRFVPPLGTPPAALLSGQTGAVRRTLPAPAYPPVS